MINNIYSISMETKDGASKFVDFLRAFPSSFKKNTSRWIWISFVPFFVFASCKSISFDSPYPRSAQNNQEAEHVCIESFNIKSHRKSSDFVLELHERISFSLMSVGYFTVLLPDSTEKGAENTTKSSLSGCDYLISGRVNNLKVGGLIDAKDFFSLHLLIFNSKNTLLGRVEFASEVDEMVEPDFADDIIIEIQRVINQ